MKAEIINIGDELLIGQVINTNATWMAEQLNLIGIRVSDILTIGDGSNDIKNAVNAAMPEHDIILITGGLGPTKDDITKHTLADLFNSRLVMNEAVLAKNKARFKTSGYELTEVNRKQAEVPENCTVIENCCGTAPGMWFDINRKIIVSMPGVPYEMKAMVENEIIPRLKALNDGQVIVHKTIMTHGLGESFLSDRIANWEDALPPYMKLAYLPRPGILRLRLSAYGTDEKALKEEVNEQIKGLQNTIPELIYGYDEASLESVVSDLLRSRKQTVSIAESCTGGFLSHCFTNLSGSSDIFKGSIIAYANEIKINTLGVKSSTIEHYGAVSEQTVIEMAEGVRKLMNTDYAVATSGIAGPSGGTKDKPVGTVWVAIATPSKTISGHFLFNGDRERNIIRSSMDALALLRKTILDIQ